MVRPRQAFRKRLSFATMKVGSFDLDSYPWRVKKLWPSWAVSLFLVALTLLVRSDAIPGEAEVARDHYGDIFSPSKMDCNDTACDQNGRQAASVPGRACECQCAPSFPTFREDLEECVRDINECPLVFFVRTFTTERIPMVFLPMTGQLVNSGAHLAISAAAAAATGGNNKSSYLCGVNSTEVMSEVGWESMSHLEKRHPLFAIYQDGRDNKSFLQWLGDDATRAQLQNRLVLIYFQCKDSNRKGNDLVHLCVAVRVGWSPGLELTGPAVKPRNNHYMIIGLCLGILGLVYVLALLVYLKIRQAKKLEREALAASLPISPESPPDNDECIATITNEFPAVLRGGIKTITTSEERKSTRSYKKQSKSSAPGEPRSHRQKNATNGSLSSSPSSGRFTDLRNSAYPGTQEIKVSRRNLYLHPELFEPDMLVSPPLPALEFLQRIREMITNARARLKNFRFRPTLVVIPEDDYFYQDSKDRSGHGSSKRRKGTEVISEVGSVPITSYSTKTKEYSSESIHGSGIGAVIVEYRVDTPPTPPKAYKLKQRRAPLPPVSKPTSDNPEAKAEDNKNVSAAASPTSNNGSGSDILPVVSHVAQDNINKFDLFRRDLYNKLTTMYSEDRNGKRHSRSRGSLVDSLTDPQYASFDSVKRESRTNKTSKENCPKENNIYTTPETIVNSEKLPNELAVEREEVVERVSQLEEAVAIEVVEIEELPEIEVFVDDPPEKLYVTVDVEVVTVDVEVVPEPTETYQETEVDDATLPMCQNTSENVVADSTPSTPYDSLNSAAARQFRAVSSVERFKEKKCLKERGAKNICLIRDGVLSTGNDDDDSCECEKCSKASSEENAGAAGEIDCNADDPSLEEYLQLSDRVAQKLSERSVPYLGSSNQSSPEATPKERTKPLSQFVKDIRVTLTKIGGHFDMPKYSRSAVPVKPSAAVEHNNWMLKKEDSVVGHGRKIIRKISMKNKKLANKIGRKFLNQNSKNDGRENGESGEPFQTVVECNDPESHDPTYEQCGSIRESEGSGDSKETIIDKSGGDDCEETKETLDNESVTTSNCYSIEVDSLKRSEKPLPDIPSQGQESSAKASKPVSGYEGDSTESESIYAPAASDLTDDSLNVNRDGPPSCGNDFSLEYETDMEPLEACLNLLANTPLELVVGGRASKGLDITEHFKSAQWEHICHDKPSNGLPILAVKNLRRRPENGEVINNELVAKNEINLRRNSFDKTEELNPETESVNGFHENGGLNGSCKQFVRNKKNGKLSDGLTRYKNGSSVRQRLPSNNSGSDDESVQSVKTDANSNYYSVPAKFNSTIHDHVIHVDNGKNDFVTLIAVQPSPCSS